MNGDSLRVGYEDDMWGGKPRTGHFRVRATVTTRSHRWRCPAGLAVSITALLLFPVSPVHPVCQGLDRADLTDWSGESTLVEAKPRYPIPNQVPGWRSPDHGWHWGNRGVVTSAAIEKPHRSGWRPILECEFDLAYSPLMELDYGRGRLVLCTLDLEDHVEARILENFSDMLVHIHQSELMTGLTQALLCAQEHTQAAAGDVFQVFEVHPAARADLVKLSLCLLRLRSIKPP